MVGGAYSSYKLSQQEVQQVEQYTGKSADDLTEEEMDAALDDLGIQDQELTADDEAAIEADAVYPKSSDRWPSSLMMVADNRTISAGISSNPIGSSCSGDYRPKRMMKGARCCPSSFSYHTGTDPE